MYYSGIADFDTVHKDLCLALQAMGRGTFCSLRWSTGQAMSMCQALFCVAVAESDSAVLVRVNCDPLLFLGASDCEAPQLRRVAGRGLDFAMSQTILAEVLVVDCIVSVEFVVAMGSRQKRYVCV